MVQVIMIIVIIQDLVEAAVGAVRLVHPKVLMTVQESPWDARVVLVAILPRRLRRLLAVVVTVEWKRMFHRL
jgi:hypothetical protein